MPRYRQLSDENPAAVRQLLAAPVKEGGLAPGQARPGAVPAGEEPDAYPASWLVAPRERVTTDEPGPTRRARVQTEV